MDAGSNALADSRPREEKGENQTGVAKRRRWWRAPLPPRWNGERETSKRHRRSCTRGRPPQQRCNATERDLTRFHPPWQVDRDSKTIQARGNSLERALERPTDYETTTFPFVFIPCVFQDSTQRRTEIRNTYIYRNKSWGWFDSIDRVWIDRYLFCTRIYTVCLPRVYSTPYREMKS